MVLRLAVVQAEPVLGDLAGNLAAVAAWVARAGERRADVVVLPEAFTTGYAADVFAGPLPSADLRWLGAVREAVDAAGVVTVLNTPLDRGERRTLTSVVLRPGREPRAAYDKQHLYDEERRWFTAGADGGALVVGETEVALSVCYDANFPEHAAAAAAAGAEVYANSGAYFPGGEHRRDLHLAARALDNGVYVAFAGLLGGPSGFIGGSAVWDPEGRPVDRVPDGVEGLVVVDVDPSRVAQVRAAQRMWADRRETLGERRLVEA